MNCKSILFSISLGATLAASAVQAQTVSGYSGDAYTIRIDESSMAPVFGDTGQLPAGGGSLTGSTGPVTGIYGFPTIAGGTSATSGGGGVANSTSTGTGFL